MGAPIFSMENTIDSSYNALLGTILPKDLQLIISLKNCSEILDFLERTIPFHCALSSCKFSVESPLKDQIATAHKGGIVRMWCLKNRILLWKERYSSPVYFKGSCSEVYSIQIDDNPHEGYNSSKTTICYCDNTSKSGPLLDGSFVEGFDLNFSPLSIGTATVGVAAITLAARLMGDQDVSLSNPYTNLNSQPAGTDNLQTLAFPLEVGCRIVYNTCTSSFSGDTESVKENHLIALCWIKENIHCLLASFLIQADAKRQDQQPYILVVNSIEHKLLSTLPLVVREYLISQFPIFTDGINFFDSLDLDKGTDELGCSLQ